MSNSPAPTVDNNPYVQSADAQPVGAQPADIQHADLQSSEGSEETESCKVRIYHQYLPVSNVTRTMKDALPSYARISMGSKLLMVELVTEFISFITSEANDKCLNDRRNAIRGDDILFAAASLGFGHYAEAMKIVLVRCRSKQNARMAAADNLTAGEAFGEAVVDARAGADMAECLNASDDRGETTDDSSFMSTSANVSSASAMSPFSQSNNGSSPAG